MAIEAYDEEGDGKGIEAVRASAHLNLPLPRLQLTWIHETEDKMVWRCRYDVLVPVARGDIRDPLRCGFAVAPMGGTIVSSEVPGWTPLSRCGTVRLPIRDGAHTAWDAACLDWPAFVVWGGRCEKIEPRVSQLLACQWES